MMQFNKFRALATSFGVVAATLILTTTGCTKVDDTLGSNLVPDDQQMKAGYTSLSGKLKEELNPKKYFETRLFQTDSIRSSNIGTGYMGSMLSDTFGLRSAGFLTQYLSYYKVDSGYFGYKPIFDSAQILLSMAGTLGDTITEQVFCIYEVIDSKYITDKPIDAGKTKKDSIFFINFDPVKTGALGADYRSKPLFKFTLGGQDKESASLKAVTLQPTEDGYQYIKRLMLIDGKYKGDYSIYGADSIEYWLKEFQGLYIAPEKQATARGGTIFETKLDASGIMVYARNRDPKDPSLVKDTVGMALYFIDENAKMGNLSINTIQHDYSMATSPLRIDIEKAKESADRKAHTNSNVMVEGMGGVVTELTFTQEFFDELEAVIAHENKISEKEFSTMAISQARMQIYFSQSDYDWQKITDVNAMIAQMESSATRLGIYTNYKSLTGIEDYPFVYEKNYGTELAYGGKINRGKGCYVMDISAYIQGLWNSYLKQKTITPAGTPVDMEKVKNRSVYIGPEAYTLYSTSYTTLQGMNIDQNKASIKIDMMYNMIK